MAELVDHAYVVLNGSGAGTVKLGPIGAREVWHPENVAVSANQSPTNEAQCLIYVGDANTKAFRDGTFTGSSGDSTDKCNADKIKVGQFIWATWTGGDPGVQATLTVTGTKDV